ncbi:uncharacterized protein N7482_001546 [Penicillium canariense]|uniref:Uncharacterized protein n=1 Tax=Penicillium canariense TaxID=189055 RepID=A0A9W9LU00_9EURO|nr:uncharacterized protein N7482_001546 [Penicillium canariense]KAJ5175669.1 hypothetical protein N7482_001546 [Penicillium canariense]
MWRSITRGGKKQICNYFQGREPVEQTHKKTENKKTYNSQDSHVVTHHTTNWPACGLSTAERTGSPVLHTLWSYVFESAFEWIIPF